MKNLKDLMMRVVAFRDEREWKQFHTPKNMALSLMLEAAEVGELFQFKSDAETTQGLEQLRGDLGRELSDVLGWVLLLANDCGVDLEAAFESKMVENERKYPTEIVRGSNKKYSEY
jgi:NTP pyrophosphatase (non-canonical NTP hydrolase)